MVRSEICKTHVVLQVFFCCKESGVTVLRERIRDWVKVRISITNHKPAQKLERTSSGVDTDPLPFPPPSVPVSRYFPPMSHPLPTLPLFLFSN